MQEAPARRRSLPAADVALLVAAGAVVAGAAVVRLAGLGRQSYWSDELFSVEASSSGVAEAVRQVLLEVHPPAYSVLLAAWIDAGGTQAGWTRLLSALLGLLAVAVAAVSLSRMPLATATKATGTAAVACAGMGVVYGQDARPYSLLLLAAVGLTGALLRWSLLEGRPTRAVAVEAALWAALAAAVHLFGLLLLLSLVAALVVVRRRRDDVRALAVVVAAGVVPQAAWLGAVSWRDGFASQTTWIEAPRLDDVVALATSVASAGGLRVDADGFAWTSAWGVAAVVGSLLVAWAAGAAAPRSGARGPRTAEARAALVLSLAAGLLVAGVLAVAQVVHIWTLRNMIVVVPALLWAWVCGCLALAGPRRRGVSVLLLVLCALSLVGVQRDLAQPYKTDFRGAIEYMEGVRAEQPDATFVVSAGVPRRWFLALDEPYDPARVDAVFSRVEVLRRTGFLERLAPREGPAVYLWYDDSTGRTVDAVAAEVIARVGGPERCSQVPVRGVVVVRCAG